MKTTFACKIVCSTLLLAGPWPQAFGQGTAFTYQGRLDAGGVPANGLYDFRFRLASDPLANNYIGSPAFTNGVGVINGLFTVALDFGNGIFTGSNIWLEADVRTNGSASYTVLSPLQALMPTPYAIFAAGASNVVGIVPSGGLSGTYPGVVTFNNAANQFNGTFAGNGAALSNVNALSLGGLGANQFWQLGGNAGTTAGVNFVGTKDNQPLELHVNGLQAFRLEPAPNGPNVIGGPNSSAPGLWAARGFFECDTSLCL